MQSSIGVVTVTFNSGEVIEPFLRSVLSQTYQDFYLYVVDNASVDSTLDRIAAFQDRRIHVIASPENLGVAAGNNKGIAASLATGCGYVLLLNNDTEFGENTFKTLLAELDRHSADMVVPKIVYHDRPDILWAAGGYFIEAIAQTHHYGDGHRNGLRFQRSRRVRYSPTTCTLMRREVFRKIGLMDENFFIYYDDTDFCLRAARVGLAQFYTPAAQVSHKVSSLTNKEPALSLHYKSRNQVYFAMKNYSPWLWPGLLLGIQLYYLGKIFRLLEPLPTYLQRQRSFVEGIRFYWRVRQKKHGVRT
nr:N-acetylglucosaminyl-diphospho-decaprenol L-rhamnosyltransferase [uncultured bacterium]